MPRLVVAICAVIVAGTFAQVPEFEQQYRQRLGGALDEVTRQVARFTDDARALGLSIEAAIARLRGNGDALARERADAIEDDIDRKARLERQQAAFAQKGAFGRAVSLVVDLDPTLAARTWQIYRPAVPTTADGLVAGGIGFVVGWLAALAIGSGARTAWGRVRRRRTLEA